MVRNGVTGLVWLDSGTPGHGGAVIVQLLPPSVPAYMLA